MHASAHASQPIDNTISGYHTIDAKYKQSTHFSWSLVTSLSASRRYSCVDFLCFANIFLRLMVGWWNCASACMLNRFAHLLLFLPDLA